MNYDRYLNARVAAVPPSGIRRFFDLAATMKDTISLGVGEPDFITPYHIRNAAINSIVDGETQYTPNRGLLALREEISAYASQNREKLRLETQLYAEYIRISDGEYRVTLKILERDVPVLDLNIVCYSKREAQTITSNWQDRATTIYKDLLLSLLQS